MMLAGEPVYWMERINWQLLAVLLQGVTLGYLVFAFRRIARNQVELAEYLKRMLEKDE